MCVGGGGGDPTSMAKLLPHHVRDGGGVSLGPDSRTRTHRKTLFFNPSRLHILHEAVLGTSPRLVGSGGSAPRYRRAFVHCKHSLVHISFCVCCPRDDEMIRSLIKLQICLEWSLSCNIKCVPILYHQWQDAQGGGGGGG